MTKSIIYMLLLHLIMQCLYHNQEITKSMLAEPQTPPYREIQTSFNRVYNDAYVFDLNNLLSNDLTQPTKE